MRTAFTVTSNTAMVNFRNVGWFSYSWTMEAAIRSCESVTIRGREPAVHGKHKDLIAANAVCHRYDTFDAIEVAFTEAIPS